MHLRLDFRRSQGSYCQSMDILVHHIKQAMIHQPMTGYAIVPFKGCRDKFQAEVPSTRSRAGMPGMGR